MKGCGVLIDPIFLTHTSLFLILDDVEGLLELFLFCVF